MNFVYLFIRTGGEWEDIIIILSKEEAINTSTKYKNDRVEIFAKNIEGTGYIPTYSYYKNGVYIHEYLAMSTCTQK
jgi:hypothetical protein